MMASKQTSATVNSKTIEQEDDKSDECINNEENGNVAVGLQESLPVGKMNQSVANLLASYGSEEFSNRLTNLIAGMNVQYQDLSALDDKDLQLLGVNNYKLRQEMLKDFSQLFNQNEHYDGVIKKNDSNAYNEELLKNAAEHVRTMKTALSAAKFKLNAFNAENILIDENGQIYSSDLVEKILEELDGSSKSIETQLNVLNRDANKADPYSKVHAGFYISIGILVSSYIFYKLVKRYFDFSFSKK